jgi:2-keto-4-pentenoate hydratase/2-oxohepta-3-ene-1,7-dioic acid hydratase in catechol pathway
VEIADQLPLNTLVLRERAAAIFTTIVTQARQLIADGNDTDVTRSLLGALNNVAIHLSELGQREAALAAVQEAVATLAPFFLALPKAFADRMVMAARNYLKHAKQLNQQPDADLLPIIEKLKILQSQTGGES